jgi:hypothetical protein
MFIRLWKICKDHTCFDITAEVWILSCGYSVQSLCQACEFGKAGNFVLFYQALQKNFWLNLDLE